MGRPAILAENLSKLYFRDRKKKDYYPTIKDVITRLPGQLRDAWTGSGRKNGQDQRSFWALQDVSFQVERGQVLGVIGCNGAGKSTLLKILARITKPSSGRAALYGSVGSLLEVGTGFHPELTGRENIYLSGVILGMSKIEIDRKFDEIVAFSGVEDFLDMPIKRYSSGMLVRLAFAVSAHFNPEILLLDEVLAVGDAEFHKKSLRKMKEVTKEGRTVVLVTHDMASARELCNSALLLDRGKLVSAGPVDHVLEKYQQSGEGMRPPEENVLRGVELVEARVFSGSALTRTINYDAPLAVEMDFRTAHPLEECCIYMWIEDASGRLLVHLSTDSQGLRPDFAAGTHTIRIELPGLWLRSGIYNMLFRVSIFPDGVPKYVDSANVTLHVLGEPTLAGVLNFPVKWSWQEQSRVE